MASAADNGTSSKRRKLNPPETSPYILRSLVDSLPIVPENGDENAHINCVEFWNGNLYIGTSASEILHFVSLPPNASDEPDTGTFILASRLQPNPDEAAQPDKTPGVQQIVLLPAVNKAIVLCNHVVTFYSLPELTPAFGNMSLQHCTSIGGRDLNLPMDEIDENGGQVIMLATNTRIMLVRLSDEKSPKQVKRTVFPACLKSMRRETIACVADSHSYSLIDVEHQQKIPLFPISSLDDVELPKPGQMEDMPAKTGHASSASTSMTPGEADGRGHGRTTSLGTFIEGLGKRQQSPRPGSGFDLARTQTPDLPVETRSPLQAGSPERKLSQPSSPTKGPAQTEPVLSESAQKALPEIPKAPITPLAPHILSPTANEFLLTTGTDPAEPGVGMFVNLDGDVVRGTIEFTKYPHTILLDGRNSEGENLESAEGNDEEGYVLAIIPGDQDANEAPKLEIQRWDIDPSDLRHKKISFDFPSPNSSSPISHDGRGVGAHTTLTPTEILLHEIGDSLRRVRLNLSGKRPVPSLEALTDTPDPRTRASLERLQKERELFDVQDSTDSENGYINYESVNAEEQANREEARRLEKWTGRILLWSGNQIWWLIRNPLLLQLDATLQRARKTEDSALDRDEIVSVINELRGQNPRTEMEFLGMNYIKQKASLLLFMDLLTNPRPNQSERQAAMNITENVLIDGGLDPRVLLLMVPLVRREVVQGPRGIWVPAGLCDLVRHFILDETSAASAEAKERRALDDKLLLMVKKYLTYWRDQKGFASIEDGQSVSKTVDASLLHILLHLDKNTQGPAQPQSIRAELNKVVDHKFGNFDRAVELLESYHRLYVLSRLYQSRKFSKDVLATWKRVIDGEQDDGGELSISEVELQIRRYLVILRDRKVIEQYGIWLAARNPRLGIQVFADNKSKVKFEPPDVIAMLKDGAPGAVQEYLEHLVFTKNQSKYADDLIGYYLDTVINVLETSSTARTSLSQSYSTYRALKPPKPTYQAFITDNAPPDPWWHSRLRLLQLLGSSRDSSSSTHLTYDIPTVLARIEPFEKELVSESIILDGHQGRHTEALRLLTHGLGDYDTAIRYCLLGGESIFSSPNTAALLPESVPSVSEQSGLFNHLLTEFLSIEDQDDRLERTSELLARFAAWYDVKDVLDRVPSDWSVDILGDFLVKVLRKLTSEKHEIEIVKALSGAENMRIQVEFLDSCEKLGGKLESDG